MDSINIHYPGAEKEYNIDFIPGFADLWDALQSKINGRKVLFVTDANIAEKSPFIQVLPKSHVLVLAPGEKTKSFASIEKIIYRCLDEQLDRDSLLIAVGGGVIGDITGFAASIFLRGIAYIQVPTTLLAMVDSSVGGKTGIDTSHGKNLVGTFYAPEAVLVCAEFFNTLPVEEVQNGLAEMIKHGAIASVPHFEALKKIASNPPQIQKILPLVPQSIQIKRTIIQADPYESNQRKLLNFGHTFGHAIEQLSGYAVPHGHAVCIGMHMALAYMQKNNIGDPSLKKEIEDLMRAFGISLEVPFSEKEIWSVMRNDKKRHGSHLDLILLKSLGQGIIHSVEITEV
jgi:3-dehydroquinate synthase